MGMVKLGSDDFSNELVGGSVEVIADDPADKGFQNGGRTVECSALGSSCIVLGSAIAKDAQVKAVMEEVNLTKGSTIDFLVRPQINGLSQESVNFRLGVTTGEVKPVFTGTYDVEKEIGSEDIVVETNDLVSGGMINSDSNPIPTDSSQVTAFESESTPWPLEDSKSQVMISQLSTTNVIETVDNSSSTHNPVGNEDTEAMVIDCLESTGNLIDKTGCQVLVDGSEYTTKRTEFMECQVTVDVSESPGNQIKKREFQVSVDGFDNPIDNQGCLASFDGSESTGNLTEKAESTESARESEECLESLITTLEINAEAESDHAGGMIKFENGSGSESSPYPWENQKPEGTVIGSVTGSEDYPGLVVMLSEVGYVGFNDDKEKLDLTKLGETQSNPTEKAESIELAIESEECLESLITTLEVNAEAESSHTGGMIKFDNGSGSESSPYPCENQKPEGTVLGSVTRSEDYPDLVVMMSEAAYVAANDDKEKLHLTELGETQVSRMEDGEPPLLDIVGERAKSKEQVNDNSESLIENTESVDLDVKLQNLKENVEIIDDNKESQIVVMDNVQNVSSPEDDAAQSANEAEQQLETETTNESTVLQFVTVSVDKTQTNIQLNGSAENLKVWPSTESVKHKNVEVFLENNIVSLCSPDDSTLVGRLVEHGVPQVTENCSAEGTDYRTEIEISDVPDDEQTQFEVKEAPDRGHSTLSFPATFVSPGIKIEFGSFGRHEKAPNRHPGDVNIVLEVSNEETEPTSGANSYNPEIIRNDLQGDRCNDNVTCQGVEDMDDVQSEGIPLCSAEGSVSEVIDAQTEEAEVPSYNFLIRVLRFDDEKLSEQLKNAQLQLDEKTRCRGEVGAEIQGKWARLKAHNEAFKAANLEMIAARRLVKLKRQEIDSVQCVIKRVKNAISVEDIDSKIYNMGHMIEHETLCLKDEKQFIREIKQLKSIRDQLASNMGSEDEIQQALNQKDQIEEGLKNLRKELNSLKDKVSKAEVAALAIGKTYEEESKKGKELQAQFRAADEVRQEAYGHLNSLKKHLYDKNKVFYMYKEDAMAARNFASCGDKAALHRLWTNQVERFMEQWNTNDEFRKDYTSRCNMSASRRHSRLDGPLCVLPNDTSEIVARSLVPIPGEMKSLSVVSTVEQGKMVPSVEEKHLDNQTMEKVAGKNNQMLNTKELAKRNSTMTAWRNEIVDNKVEEETTPTREVLDFAKKAEELRKEETASKLKEQRRSEEKAKATEAMERKKRNAEKAQMRAELRAQKEAAEQRVKAREKHSRKKEKKRAGGNASSSINGEDVAESNEAKEIDKTNKKPQRHPPPHLFSKQLKPKNIPLPPAVALALASRNKKRWQRWGKMVVIVAALILVLFVLSNTDFFRLFKSNNSS